MRQREPGQTIGAPAGRAGALRSQVPARPRAAFGEREPAATWTRTSRRDESCASCEAPARSTATPTRWPTTCATSSPRRTACDREQVLVGNGGDELLFDLALAWGGPGRTFLNLPPTFSVYGANARLTNTHGGERAAPAPTSPSTRTRCWRAWPKATSTTWWSPVPNNPTGNAGRRGVPLRAAGRHRRARDGGRGVLRVLPHHHAPRAGAAREPGHPAHVFQGVLARGRAHGLSCWGTPRSSASS